MKMIIALGFISLTLSSCTANKIYIGKYTEGFEWSFFIECGGSEKFWINSNPAIIDMKKALEQDGIIFSYELGDENPSVPVKLRGSLSKKGNWGHLGRYKYELNVVQYLAHGSEIERECEI